MSAEVERVHEYNSYNFHSQLTTLNICINDRTQSLSSLNKLTLASGDTSRITLLLSFLSSTK
jgi:hypothetical protein